MARNVEIKARAHDLAAIERRTAALADQGPTLIAQDDTFFYCDAGRLKLRAFGDGSGELIFYTRGDTTGPKTSTYFRTPTTDPDGLCDVLARAHGIRGRVLKQRTLYLIGATRVHLDRVRGLGDFVELEVVLRDDQPAEEGVATAHKLLAQLGIGAQHLLVPAYIDLLEQKAASR